MRSISRIVLGTRGSDLARAQTRLVEEALRSVFSEVEIETQLIATRGDEKAGAPNEPIDRQAGRKGLFTSEIERALQGREIDVAVHSAKDLPSTATPGLEIRATLPRAPVEDILVLKRKKNLASLTPGGMIATGSVRRKFQLLWRRPDLQIVDLRGNVPTRLRKLTSNNWAAIVLARAGVERLGHDLSAGFLEFEGQAFALETLSPNEFLPAGGQGVIALQIRSEDAAAQGLLDAINHSDTLLCLKAEREFLRLLQGDCDSPVGVLAEMKAGEMQMRAQVFEDERAAPLCVAVSGGAAELPAKLMEKLHG